MRLVLDTNILFTYFWENSAFRDICNNENAEFFAPVFALKEIDKYKEEIIRKTHITLIEFVAMRKEMGSHITFIDEKNYKKYYKEIKVSLKALPVKEQEEILEDVDFLAIAHMICCPLWSNDKLLKNQKDITVLNTDEIISILDIS